MTKEFKIQVPQSIVRSSDISDKDFVLLTKLIQLYQSQSGINKNLTFTIVSYKRLMNFINMVDRRTFVACLKSLYKNKLITEEIISLPRNGKLTITLSPIVVPDLNKGQMFTQFEHGVVSMSVIEKVGHTGVRLLYYLKSWINYKQVGKDHCYASVERMSNDIGVTEKTFIKYIVILEKAKFIKVVRHDNYLEYKDDKNGNENLLIDRWNNHYFIKHDNIKKFIESSTSLVC